MTHPTTMTQGKPLSLLLTFAIPLMFGNIFQQLYTIVDVAIIGRGVGMDALAALGCVDWLNWMMLGLAQGFTQGFSIRIAQKFGAGAHTEMKVYIGQTVVLSVIISCAYLLLGQILLPFLLRLLQVPTHLRAMAEIYTRVLLLGAPALMGFNACASMLRAIGDSKTPLQAMACAASLNILLDLLAVFGLGWGIAGAAAATIVAQVFSCIFCAVKIAKTPLLCFGKKELQKNTPVRKNLILIGTPAAAKNIVIAIGGMGVQAVVNGFGTGFIAGFTATSKLYGLLEIAAISYGYAVTTYVSQNFGAQQKKRIQEGVRTAIFLAFATSLLIALAMFLFGRELTALFISSENPALAAEAKAVAYLFLRIMALFLPVLYLLYVYLSALQGMGYTIHTFLSSIIEFLLRISIAALVAQSGYAYGIFGAEVLAWLGAMLYLMLQYQKKLRQILAQ